MKVFVKLDAEEIRFACREFLRSQGYDVKNESLILVRGSSGAGTPGDRGSSDTVEYTGTFTTTERK